MWNGAKLSSFSSLMDERARARILLLAAPTSYRVSAYRSAAQSIGVDLLIGSEGEYSLISRGVDGISVSLRDPNSTIEKILKEAAQRRFDGVIAADDSTVELTSRVAAALGLPHNPVSAAQNSRRKDLGRECLRAAGLPVPNFSRIDLHRDLSPQVRTVAFPCVAKPIALSGSRGVIRANEHAQLLEACTRIQRMLSVDGFEQEASLILVEDYIPGQEIALEGLLRDGVLQVLAIFDKPEPLEGPFFAETYYVTPSRHPVAVQQQIIQTIAKACEAYGLREGPVHAEARLNKDQVWVLEIAARTIGGGLCPTAAVWDRK